MRREVLRVARPVAGLIALAVLAGIGINRAHATDPERIADAGAELDFDALPVLAPSAPAVVADGWLNTRPLGPSDLAGKVVLYDFWTFGCVNCQHTLPYVKAWYDRYSPDGLVVLSVHTPEFDYEADPERVAEYVMANSIAFPVRARSAPAGVARVRKPLLAGLLRVRSSWRASLRPLRRGQV